MALAQPFQKMNRLRQERLQRHWRQADLAEQLGTTELTIRRWERGSQQPSAYYRLKLSALFGKSAQELGFVESDALLSTSVEGGEAETVQPSSSPAEELALWTVPYPRNPHFTGREELLDQLDQCLTLMGPGNLITIRQATLTQAQAITGLGGIGKTQIAVEYAYRAHAHYTHILWINAASEETILTSLVTLAEQLPAFSAQEENDQQRLVGAIKEWLEQCQYRWLCIFDNAENLSLVRGYFPKRGKGSILLTTRAHAVGSLAASIEVEPMGLLEGTHFLLQRAQRLQISDEERKEAMNVVVALDGFPLALDQAGAYIEETRCTFADYLQIYQKHRKILLARRGKQNTNYPDSVATTWSLSFQALEQANPATTELLRLCAFLAPDRIPEELIQKGAPYWSLLLQQAAGDLFAFNHLIEDILSFSLIKRLPEEHLLTIHRLVQAVLLDAMEPEEQHQWAERVIRAVNAVFPHDPKKEVASWPQCSRYLEQAQNCDTLIQQHHLLLPEAADLLDRTGTYLRERALYTIAEPLFQRAISIRVQQLGAEHPEAEISPLSNLAILYRLQGKYAEAESLFQRALAISEQQLGPEHPEVALLLSKLALVCVDQGKYAEAEFLFQRALAISEQQLGPEHLQVSPPLAGLAILLAEQGKYAEAESLFERVLRIREQTLEPQHPDIAETLHDFAVLREAQGNAQEAVSLYQRALVIREQALGGAHPKTVKTRTALLSHNFIKPG